MSRKKILFIATHRLGRSPSQRFRFEQYLDFITKNGFDWELSSLISEEDDVVLYSNGNYIKKAIIAKKSWFKRLKDSKRADNFDLIFIQREALLTRSSKFERLFASSKAKIIFDFDDAVWLPNVSKNNKSLQLLKNPAKINLKYLTSMKKVFVELKKKYGDLIYFKIICNSPWDFDEVPIKNEKWNISREIEQLAEIDIGVMPLFENEWSKGKCGFKGLQYMAMEKAAVLSPVGVNSQIINNGVNGFLAKNHEEWMRSLSLLIEDSEIRKKVGKAGRQTIEEHYSVNKWKSIYLKYFNKLIQ